MCWRKIKVKGTENAAAGNGECVYMSKAACKVFYDKLHLHKNLKKVREDAMWLSITNVF